MTNDVSRDSLEWRQLHWSRPLALGGPEIAIRSWATDPLSPRIVLETRASNAGTRYLLATPRTSLDSVLHRLRIAVPDAEVSDLTSERRHIQAAARLKLSSRHRPIRPDAAEEIALHVHGALAAVRDDEQLVLQLLLVSRRIPLAVPNQSPSSIVMPLWEVAWRGNGGQVDGEKRAALREKVGDHGFTATLRIGVHAGNPHRRRTLLLGLYSALRTGEAPGLKSRLVSEAARHLNDASRPWLPPLRLNVSEVLALSGWPVGDADLPGLPPLHPKQVAPRHLAANGDIVIGKALAPGVDGHIGLPVEDARRGVWLLGPNGTGKTTAMQHAVLSFVRAKRPVVVVEPKDLVRDLLRCIPEHRQDDVVVIDCTDESPVGLNPLERRGRRPELVADGLLATFENLYGDGLGPRSTDILSNCLTALAHHDDASIVMIPTLLSNAGFRRSMTAAVIKGDPIVAAPFWAWFNSLGDEARSHITAPLANKLRPLLRPQLRGVLGQRHPRFNLREAIATNKIVLVPLRPGVIGPAAAQLLAALVLAEVWLAIRERAAVPESDRVDVGVFVDEAQDYMRLGTDISDALATSRSLRAQWWMAHQFRDQLDSRLKATFESNLRNRVAFTLTPTDARALAAGQSVISPDDFTSLPAYHIYAQLLHHNSVEPWVSAITLPPPEPCSDPDEVRARSRALYGQPLDEIEAGFANLLEGSGPESGATQRRRRPT